MKTTIHAFAFLVCLLLSGQVFSQQLPSFNLYQNQRFLLNPAYAGETDFLQGFIDSKRQWVGVPGAPVTSVFGLHKGVTDKMGLGLQVSSDKAALLERLSGQLNYSYKVNLSNNKVHFLAMGIGLGFVDNKLNFSEGMGNPNDPFLMNGDMDGISLDAAFGARYHYSDFEIGFAIPQLLNAPVNYQGGVGNDQEFSLKNHFVMLSSYRFRFFAYEPDPSGVLVKSKSERFSLEPSILFRALPYIPSQIDAGLTFRNASQQWLGVIYRPTNSGVVLSAGLPILSNLHVGYAYEFSNSKMADYSTGTHEFMLVYQFSGKKDSRKEDEEKEWKKLMETKLNMQKTLLQRQLDSLSRELSALHALAQTQPSTSAMKEQIEKLQTELSLVRSESLNRPVPATDGAVIPPANSSGDRLLQEQVSRLQNEINQLKSSNQVDRPNTSSNSELADIKKELEDLRRYVKTVKGEDVVELKAAKDANNNDVLVEGDYRDGCYVVIHSLRSIENAKRAVIIEKERGNEVSILYNKTRQWYYVNVFYHPELQPALVKMKEVRKNIQPEAWVHIYRH